MVPSISRNGRSFRGAGAYHLHDKPSEAQLRPRTTQRVVFTATRNLANEEPHAALDEMWRTAADAVHLKALVGGAPTGRKNDTPVKTLSLAWAPGQTPSQKDMCAAADSFLNSMGWHQHQALYVAHNDTHHPHLHVILNRVHPDTGRTLNDWQERKRAQKWALAYERHQGSIVCPARAAKDAKWSSPPTGLPHPQARLLKPLNHNARKEITRAARTAFRPAWAAHYRSQRAALARHAHRARSARRIALSLSREGNPVAALQQLDRVARQRALLLRAFTQQRSAIARAQGVYLRAQLASRHQYSPAIAHTRPLTAARNDNARAFETEARCPPIPPIAAPLFPMETQVLWRVPKHRNVNTADHGAKRTRQIVPQAAANNRLRSQAPCARAATLARADIALQFANRWAEIRRLPATQRGAAVATLRAEQDAAFAARLLYHASSLRDPARAGFVHLKSHGLLQRRALTSRHRRAWGPAAALLVSRERNLHPLCASRPKTGIRPRDPPRRPSAA